MRFVELVLENFRGIKKAIINFNGQNTDIYGDNGTGKTTIGNAICWILTDQAITSEKDFTPKTQGTHDLHHVARLRVKTDEHTITFEKDYHEVWKKKRGSATPEFSGHVTDYAVNGVPYKKKEYEAAILSACGDIEPERIKMLTILGFFSETLKADDRRRLLFDICGDVSDDEVIAGNHLEALTEVLKMPGDIDNYYSIDEYKKIALEQRRKLNKQLEMIPERIDELQRSVPENLPEVSIENLKERINSLEKEKKERLATFTPDCSRQALQAAIAGIETGIEKERAAYMAEMAEKHEQIFSKKFDLMKERDVIRTKADKVHIERIKVKGEIEKLKQRRQELLDEFKTVQEMQFNVESEICPTCGRRLPEEEIQSARAKFNQNKAERKRQINEEGQACSKEAIQVLEAKELYLSSEYEGYKAEELKFDDAIKEQIALQKEDSYESTESYKEMAEKLKKLKERLEGVPSQIAVCDTKDLDEGIYTLQEQIGAQQASKRARERIKELQDEQSETGKKLEEAERGIYLCEEFIRAKVRMVTENINSRFHTVRWQLFKEQINGGLKECCEPMIPNSDRELIEYKSANTAAKVNAGLEIIAVLNKHFKTNLPIIIDQAESVCRVREMDEQIIRLIVSEPDKELRVENREC